MATRIVPELSPNVGNPGNAGNSGNVDSNPGAFSYTGEGSASITEPAATTAQTDGNTGNTGNSGASTTLNAGID